MENDQNVTPNTEGTVAPPEAEAKPKTHRTTKPKGGKAAETPKFEAAAVTVEPPLVNVYQKLLKARVMFLASGVTKSGVNTHLKFDYFELADIVPPVTRIFSEVGLIGLPNFIGEKATLDIVNVDDPEQVIVFTAPFDKIQPIISNKTGSQATNPMQALGSSITYMRRYLYMMAMDIVEADSIDANLGNPFDNYNKAPEKPAANPAVINLVPNAAAKPNNAPVSAEKREAITSILTDADGPADKLQIDNLKAALSEWLKKDPSAEGKVTEIALKTQGFTEISKTECENIMNGIALLLKGGEKA